MQLYNNFCIHNSIFTADLTDPLAKSTGRPAADLLDSYGPYCITPNISPLYTRGSLVGKRRGPTTAFI